jgi:hypothetical protein
MNARYLVMFYLENACYFSYFLSVLAQENVFIIKTAKQLYSPYFTSGVIIKKY